jgi:DNA-binding NarL/FixJ family response regulator
MTVSPLTIVVAEDHPLFRRALVALLAGHPGWQVVAEVEDGISAVTAVHAEQPDVVLMDLKLPELDGIEATRRIVGASPHVAVLVLTMYDDDTSVFEAMRAGARGYLLKGADEAEIVRAVGRGGRRPAGWSSSSPPPGLPHPPRLSSPSSPRGSTRCSTSSPPAAATPTSP